MSNGDFYVYVHSRPSGEPFYVGKGRRRRAYDMSPARRTAHHRHICVKYGLTAVKVALIPMPCEASAFEFEVFLIDEMRRAGLSLCNITDGGEGASMPATPEKLEMLDRGRDTRWRGKQYTLGLKLGGRQCHCDACGVAFIAAKGRSTCSKRCEQIAYRAKTAMPVQRVRLYANNKTGHAGVNLLANGKFTANIGEDGRLLHLGTFATRDDALSARLAAEARFAASWNGGLGARTIP